MDRAEVANGLRRGRIVDSGWLAPAARQDLEAALGDRVWVVLAERGSDLRALRPVWNDLSLDPERDLLVLYNGERWEARGWGLDDAAIAEALDRAEPALATDPAAGIRAAMDELDAARGGVPWGWVGGAGGVFALGLGWIVWRREKVARERRTAALTDAKGSAELAYANLILDADRLGPDSFDLQQRASRLRRELDSVARDTADPNVRAGRMRQVEDEITALQSTVLQRQKEKGP